MKNRSTFGKTLALACISLAIPLTLQAEPIQAETTQAPPRQGERMQDGPAHGMRGGYDRPEHDCGQRHGGGPDGQFMHGMPPGVGMGIPPYLRGVNLTEAQRDKLFNLTYSQLPAMREKMKLHMKTVKELRALSTAETFDDAKAQQLATQLAATEKDMALGRARNEAAIYAILTPEQRQKVSDDRKK